MVLHKKWKKCIYNIWILKHEYADKDNQNVIETSKQTRDTGFISRIVLFITKEKIHKRFESPPPVHSLVYTNLNK